MLDFLHPQYLWLLFLIPAIYLLYRLARYATARRLSKFGDLTHLAPMMSDRSQYKPKIKITLQLLALAMIIIIIARPRYGQTQQTTQRSGIEIAIAFDLSRSMYAPSTDDPASTPRLRRAKLLLDQLIDKLKDDKTSLTVFANTAITKLPLTTDHYTTKLILSDLDPETMPDQGTDIAAAITRAQSTLSQKQNTHRAIIIITDAEDNQGQAIQAAKYANEQNIQVNTITVGTATATKIPMPDGTYLTDPTTGQDATTTIDIKTAQQIAQAGGGIHIDATDPDALDKLSQQLDKLGKTKFKDIQYTTAGEQFPTFAWLALLLLLIDTIISQAKNPWLKNKNIFTPKTKRTKTSHKLPLVITLILTTLAITSCTQPQSIQSNKTERNAIKEGNEAYFKQKYNTATLNYSRALKANPTSEVAQYNHAISTLMGGTQDTAQISNARTTLDKLGKTATDRQIAHKAIYNLAGDAVLTGDAYKAQADTLRKNPTPAAISLADSLSQIATQCYQQAINNYKTILRKNPKDLQTLQNLRITQLKLPPQNNQQNQNKQDKQQNDKNKQQQQPKPQQSPQQQSDDQTLQAIQNKENQTRQNQQRAQRAKTTTDKPW